MIFNAMRSDDYNLEYMEVSREHMNTRDYGDYDFFVVNWHHNTLPIASSTIAKLRGLKIGIVLEVGPLEQRPFMREDMFDAYMLIDPTKDVRGKHYPFPRPLEKAVELLPLLSDDIPVFGTFGFLVPGKNFGEVLQQANDYKKPCILRMNFPNASFTGQSPEIAREFSRRMHIFKNGNVDLRITFDYMSKPELIRWCSQHTLNVFPYYRDLPGLSAVTDQAIVAGRGIAITNCNTFRHMHKYISFYPEQSYIELSKSTLDGVKQMSIDWSNENFVTRFKELLSERMK
jgi:hypothetical protein